MPDLPISGLPSYTTPLAGDLIPIKDVATGITKKVRFDAFPGVKHKPVLTFFTQTTAISVSNTTATILGTGIGTKTILANEMIVGTSFRIQLTGNYSSSGGTPSVTFTLSLGGTTLVYTIHTLAASQSGQPFQLEGRFTCKTIGASGTVTSNLVTSSKAVGSSQIAQYELNSFTTVINTTISQAINITATVGSGEAIQIVQGSIEQLN